jgi:SWI/SNF-related matrix-associated actin-dependent regulator 1 of chromatin subfamily A
MFIEALSVLDAIDAATELNGVGLNKNDKSPLATWRIDEKVAARTCLRYRRQLPADIVAAARAAVPTSTPTVSVSADGAFALSGFCPKEFFATYLRICKSDFRGKYLPDAKAWRLAPADHAAAIECLEIVGFIVLLEQPESATEREARLIAEEAKANTVQLDWTGDMFTFKISSYNTDFNAVFSNVYGETQWIFGYDPKTHARETSSILAARDAASVLSARGFLVAMTTRYQSAERDYDARMAGFANTSQDVQSLLADGISFYSHQNRALEFIKKAGGNILLGAAMGAGKTPISLAHIARNNLKAIVICPKVMRKTWTKEAQKFFPTYFKDVVELKSVRDISKITDKTTLISCNYESAQKYIEAATKYGFSCVVVDESHYIKNAKTKRFDVVNAVASISSIRSRILLSGTAVKNNRYEIIPQIRILNEQKADDISGIKYLGDFWHGIQDVYLSMPKAEVLAFLPAKRTERNEFEVKKPCGLPESIEEITKFKHDCAVSKIEATCELIEEILESSDENVLIFSEFHDVVSAVKEHFGDIAILHHGQLSDDVREKAKEDFQKPDSTARIFVSTRPSLAVGATLTRASRVVFNDLPWNMADIQQAEDRCFAAGTRVQTTNGFVNIEDLKAGDFVIGGKSGKPCKIIDAWKTENQPIVELKISGAEKSIKCTENHRFLALDEFKDVEWIEAKNMASYNKKPRKYSTVFSQINNVKSDLFFEVDFGKYSVGVRSKNIEKTLLSDEMLFMFGYYIGDGFCRTDNSKSSAFVSFAGNSGKKKASLERLSKFLISLGLNESKRISENGIGVETRFSSTQFSAFMSENFGRICEEKHVPEFLFNLSKRQSLVLMSGLLASDGYVRNNYAEYVCKSDVLAANVCLLSSLCGYRPSMRRQMKGHNVVGFSLLDGNNNSAKTPAKLKSIKHVCAEDVYDITVEDDECFLIENGIIAHNCHRIGQINPVVVHWIVAENSEFDSNLTDIIEQKAKIQKAVTEGKKLTADELNQLQQPVSFRDLIAKKSEVTK